MAWLAKLLAGSIPARDAFWGWLVFRGFLVNVACSAAALALVATAADDAILPLWIAALLHLAAVPFNVVCLLGVWRAVERQVLPPRDASILRTASLAVFVTYLVL